MRIINGRGGLRTATSSAWKLGGGCKRRRAGVPVSRNGETSRAEAVGARFKPASVKADALHGEARHRVRIQRREGLWGLGLKKVEGTRRTRNTPHEKNVHFDKLGGRAHRRET